MSNRYPFRFETITNTASATSIYKLRWSEFIVFENEKNRFSQPNTDDILSLHIVPNCLPIDWKLEEVISMFILPMAHKYMLTHECIWANWSNVPVSCACCNYVLVYARLCVRVLFAFFAVRTTSNSSIHTTSSEMQNETKKKGKEKKIPRVEINCNKTILPIKLPYHGWMDKSLFLCMKYFIYVCSSVYTVVRDWA